MAQALTEQTREQAYQEELSISRRVSARLVERGIGQLARKIAVKLEKQIRDGDDVAAIGILIFLAFLKDGLLDIGLNFLGIGLVPVIGQIPGWFVSATLYYFMYGKGYFLKQRARMNMRGWLFVFGFILDGLPAVEELPITTLTVAHTIRLVKKRARQAKKDLDSLRTSTQEQITSLDKELAED